MYVCKHWLYYYCITEILNAVYTVLSIIIIIVLYIINVLRFVPVEAFMNEGNQLDHIHHQHQTSNLDCRLNINVMWLPLAAEQTSLPKLK